MGGTISSSLTNAPGGMGGSAPFSLSIATDGMAGGLPLACVFSGGAVDAAPAAAACPSGKRATHSAASSAVAKLPRLTLLPPRSTRAR